VDANLIDDFKKDRAMMLSARKTKSFSSEDGEDDKKSAAKLNFGGDSTGTETPQHFKSGDTSTGMYINFNTSGSNT
jgi:hypothetical protein